jgi:hypothetical protein
MKEMFTHNQFDHGCDFMGAMQSSGGLKSQESGMSNDWGSRVE